MGNPHNDRNVRKIIIKKANDVIAVFQGYENRLRELGVSPGGLGESNTQRDALHSIVTNAQTALDMLKSDDQDASTALDRALKRGEYVEEQLKKLVESLPNAPATPDVPTTIEPYRAAHFVPVLPDKAYIQFDSRDENGMYCAPEGDLKSALLKSTTMHSVIAASGAATSVVIVHGASGMAGVGKTTALIALGHDRHVRNIFKDGVLCMVLGADASGKHVTDKLAEIMKFTGAKESATAVRNEDDLKKAVKGAALWFQGKRNLFLIDDIWDQGYLPIFRWILTGSTHSRIVLTTRSRAICSCSLVGSYGEFDARDPHGPTSTAIFMGYATKGCHIPEDIREKYQALESVQGILGLCAGLPIALGVTGGYVAERVSVGLEFVFVCSSYLKDLQDSVKLGSSVLESAINLSLKYLNSALKNMTDFTPAAPSADQMYESLCGLEKQQCVPVAVLAVMWGVSEKSANSIFLLFSSMSLAKALAQENFVGLTVHDLHHEYCSEKAQKEDRIEKWHLRLLKGARKQGG